MILKDINLAIWIPVTITIIGFISYYLGRVISDIHPQQDSKQLNYIQGFIFLLVFILLPLTIIYEFRSILILKLNTFLTVIFCLGFILLFSILNKKKDLFFIKINNAGDIFESEVKKHTEEVSKSMGLKIDKSYFEKIMRNLFFRMPSSTTILIFSFIQIFILINIINNIGFYFLDFIFIILFIQVISDIAILHTAKMIKYPEIKIKMSNGNKYEGKLIKIDSDFISIRKEKEIINLTKSNMESIQQEGYVNNPKNYNNVENLKKLLIWASNKFPNINQSKNKDNKIKESKFVKKSQENKI